MTSILLLDEQGKQLLTLLVAKLPKVQPSDPRTFISYKDVHDQLGLPHVLETYGESLKNQGLASLAEWTFGTGKPGITGLIIDRTSMIPGKGYFDLFGKPEDDFKWWAEEIKKSKEFNWAPYVHVEPPPAPPPVADIDVPTGRKEITTLRIIRDTFLARRVKQMHNYECQICGQTILLADGGRYAEAHHIQPLGDPHKGPDIFENIVCVCPNHHAELDYGARSMTLTDLRQVEGHSIAEKYVVYHNAHICKLP